MIYNKEDLHRFWTKPLFRTILLLESLHLNACFLNLAHKFHSKL